MMKRTRIKFCGMTRAQDVRAAVTLGVDALGFVLVPESRRWIEPEAAAALCQNLPPFVDCVALFRNADAPFIEHAIAVLQPDLLQFHGEEPAAFCARFGRPWIKALAMAGAPPTPAQLAGYAPARALLLDGHAPGTLGGQGQRFDWNVVTATGDQPLILAGGLDAGNVGAAIERLRPYAVDVSSGIEAAPGVKDFGKMADFVDAVRRADLAPSTASTP